MTRLLVSLYGFAFLNKFLLLTPVYTIFMLNNGVSDFMLSTMFIISAAGTILGQVPVAYLTNRMGQRRAMIFGQFLKVFAVLLWLFMPTLTGFIVGMFLWGIQAGFRSVAFEGLVYDAVASRGMAHDYPRILGRKSTYESIGTALSAFGSLLMFLGYDWVTWASVMAILLSIICLMSVPYRPNMTRSAASQPRFYKLLRTGVRVALHTPCLVTTVLLALFAANIPYLDDFLSPIGIQLGIPETYVGAISLFLLACATLGQRFAYKFSNLSDRFIYAMIGLVGICYLIFSHLYTVHYLWLMGIAYAAFYGVYTLLFARVQHMTPARHRSVVLSLYTVVNYLIYMAVCGIVGLGSMLGSWRFSIMILGILMVLLCVYGALYVRGRCCMLSDTDL